MAAELEQGEKADVLNMSQWQITSTYGKPVVITYKQAPA